MQKIADRPVSRCEKCNERVTRVFHPVAIHFKGSGFYSTDYGKKHSDKRQKSVEKTGGKSTNKTGEQSGNKDKGKHSQKKAAAGAKDN